MTDPALIAEIDALWERRSDLTSADGREASLVDEVIDKLDRGQVRVAEKVGGEWVANQWLKKACLLSFRLNDNQLMVSDSRRPRVMMGGTPGPVTTANEPLGAFWDKVPNKFAGWTEMEFQAAGFRAVPGCVVRRGAFVASKVVLMPSFVNLGAYVDEGTMIDTWATVGSCAQIGKNVHISGGAGIGGVFEPLQAAPTIIEDGCFIGARSEVAEGVIVEEGAVLSMGVFISASTRIVDRETGEIYRGRVPAYSVVVPGSLGGGPGIPALSCAVIVKRVDAQTRAKTSVNELLRD
jgi:2,3,4,5-tetrahydropyridine-2-carboxylate N-succinyltransferase